MFILSEENTELKDELEKMRAMTYDDRIKIVGTENLNLKKRNGELLVEITDVKAELAKLKH